LKDLTIIYPYREREIERVKISLDSLLIQTNSNFQVLIVDYGSKKSHSIKIQELIKDYSFVTYQYSYNQYQPWSRAKAINIGLRIVETTHVFIADIDIIFRNDFIEKLSKFKNPESVTYFKVGFLTKQESGKKKPFEKYKIKHYSGVGAQGMSIFPLQIIKRIRGYDEFFNFWGAEDEDIHNRILSAGYKVNFHKDETFLLHRWHPSYRAMSKNKLTSDLQIENISVFNQEHLRSNKANKNVLVNDENWGQLTEEKSLVELQDEKTQKVLLNRKQDIEHFLYVELPNLKNTILNVFIEEDNFKNSIKYKLKKIIGKKVPNYYTLKEINDLLLMHIISFYRNNNYIYKVSDNLKAIEFKIKKK
jgi:hypothetical protein